MASRRMYRMFPSWLFRAVCSRGNLAASTRRNLANSFGVVGTLIQPRGNVSVTPWPETRSAPDGACEDDETGVLSFRLAHRLCPAWNAPHPRASPTTAAATRTSGCLIALDARRPGSWAPGWPGGGRSAWGVAAGSGLMSAMAIYSLAGPARPFRCAEDGIAAAAGQDIWPSAGGRATCEGSERMRPTWPGCIPDQEVVVTGARGQRVSGASAGWPRH